MFNTHSFKIAIFLCFSTLLLTGCAGVPRGPKIRLATATPAQLKEAETATTVWYEFRPGDVVPVRFGFLGDVEGGVQEPSVMRAKHLFYFVIQKNGPIRMSFDGKTFAGEKSNQSVIAVVPRKNGTGGELLWLFYIGKEGNVQAEVDRLLQ